MSRPICKLLLVLALCWPVPGLGAIAVDATNKCSADNAAGTTLNCSHTVPSGSDRMLFVEIAWQHCTATVTSVTYTKGGSATAMTSAGASVQGNNCENVQLFYMVAPDVGTANVALTMSAAPDEKTIIAINLTGVDQTTAISNYTSTSGASGNPSLNVTSGSEKLVLDGIFQDCFTDITDPTAGAGQTKERTHQNGSCGSWAGVSSEAGAGTTTMSWTFNVTTGSWVQAGLSVNEAAGGAGVVPTRMLLGVGP